MGKYNFYWEKISFPFFFTTFFPHPPSFFFLFTFSSSREIWETNIPNYLSLGIACLALSEADPSAHLKNLFRTGQCRDENPIFFLWIRIRLSWRKKSFKTLSELFVSWEGVNAIIEPPQGKIPPLEVLRAITRFTLKNCCFISGYEQK